jgi:polyhydroxyalkanoate synthesis regulator phasin
MLKKLLEKVKKSNKNDTKENRELLEKLKAKLQSFQHKDDEESKEKIFILETTIKKLEKKIASK